MTQKSKPGLLPAKQIEIQGNKMSNFSLTEDVCFHVSRRFCCGWFSCQTHKSCEPFHIEQLGLVKLRFCLLRYITQQNTLVYYGVLRDLIISLF